MTFCADTGLVDDVWKIVSKHITRENQPRVAHRLAEVFTSYGCDTLQATPLWDLITLKCYCAKEDEDASVDCLRCSGKGYIRRSFD